MPLFAYVLDLESLVQIELKLRYVFDQFWSMYLWFMSILKG